MLAKITECHFALFRLHFIKWKLMAKNLETVILESALWPKLWPKIQKAVISFHGYDCKISLIIFNNMKPTLAVAANK